MLSVKKQYQLQVMCYALMLLLVFGSLLVLHFQRAEFLPYVLLVCVSVVAICVFSTAVQPQHVKSQYKIRFWRKLMQWLGFLVAIYLDLLTLKYGMASAVNVGIFALILLAATLFFLGAIDHLPMALLGMTVAVLLAGSVALPDRWMALLVLIAMAMALLIFWCIRRDYLQMDCVK